MALLTAQFGCAGMPKRTEPAVVVYRGEPSSISPVSPDTMDYNCYRYKMAELKGKISTMHPGEPAFAALGYKAEVLDSAQIEHEGRNVKARNRAVTAGMIIPLAVVGGFGLWGISQMDGTSPEADAIIGGISYTALLLAPLFAGGGALVGAVASGAAVGEDARMEHKKALAELIGEYNELDRAANGPGADSTSVK